MENKPLPSDILEFLHNLRLAEHSGIREDAKMLLRKYSRKQNNLNKCPSCNGCGKIFTVFDKIIDCNDDFHKCKGCGNIKDGINFLCEKCFDI